MMNTLKRNKKKKKAKKEDYEILGEIYADTSNIISKKIQRKSDGKVFMWNEIIYCSMTKNEKHMLVSELELLKALRSNSVIHVVDYIDDEDSNTIYIIKEYFGNNISLLMKRCKQEYYHLEEHFIWKFLYQLSSSLQECHLFNESNHMLINHGLRPTHIFLDNNWNIKFGDYGLTHQWNVSNQRASFHYVSPEQVNVANCTEKSDVWSLGCLLYELCSLVPPFSGANWFQLTLRIKNGQIHRIPWRYSDDLQNIISNMITVQEELRPTFKSLLNNHHVQKWNAASHQEPTDKPSTTFATELQKRLKGLKKQETLPRTSQVLKNPEAEPESFGEQVDEKIKCLEAHLSRAEKFLSEITRQQTSTATFAKESKDYTGKRSKSLERNEKDKRRVRFVYEKRPENDKENNVDPHKNLAIDFEKRRSDLQKRLRDAQDRALELRTKEIQPCFFEHLAFL